MKSLFKFNFKGKIVHSNVNLDLEWLEKNHYGDAEDNLKELSKDLDFCMYHIKDQRIYWSNQYFFVYKYNEEYIAMSIYEPNDNNVRLGNMLAIVGHEQVMLIDLNAKTYVETHTR